MPLLSEPPFREHGSYTREQLIRDLIDMYQVLIEWQATLESLQQQIDALDVRVTDLEGA